MKARMWSPFLNFIPHPEEKLGVGSSKEKQLEDDDPKISLIYVLIFEGFNYNFLNFSFEESTVFKFNTHTDASWACFMPETMLWNGGGTTKGIEHCPQ